MSEKFLDLVGLEYYNEKIKATYATKDELHTDESAIEELKSYFTGGVANKAEADALGQAIASTYVKGVVAGESADKLVVTKGDNSQTTITINNVGHAAVADNASTLEGHPASYFATADALTSAVNGIVWRPTVANTAELQGIAAPKEGWTCSVTDTNNIYRFDTASIAVVDNDMYVQANDNTPGRWVKLGTTVYSAATNANDGIMTKEQVKALEKATADIQDIQEQFTGGVANSAAKLQTPHNFSITGGATATAVSFDGTADVVLTVTTVDATKLSGIVPDANLNKAAVGQLGVVKLGADSKLTCEDGLLKADFVTIQTTEIDDLFA